MLEQILKTILMDVLLVTLIVGALAVLAICIRMLIGALYIGSIGSRGRPEDDEKK